MSTITIKIKEENELDPILFTAIFVAVFFLPFFLIFQSSTLSILSVLVISGSYFVINYTSMYLEIDAENRTCSIFKNQKKMSEYSVSEICFSWHALILVGSGSLYQNAGSQQSTSRRQNRLQCLLTLDEEMQIRLINEQWPWQGLPAGWEHRMQLDSYNGKTYFVKRDLIEFCSNYKKAIIALEKNDNLI